MDVGAKDGKVTKSKSIYGCLFGHRRVAGFLLILMLLLVAWTVETPSAQEDQAGASAEQTEAASADTIPPDLKQAREVLGRMETTLDSIRTIESRMKGKSGDELAVLRVQGRGQFMVLHDLQPQLLKLILKLEAAGLPAADLKKKFQAVVTRTMDYYIQGLNWWSEEIDELRERRSSASAKEMGEVEKAIGDARERLDLIYRVQVETLTAGDSLGLDTDREWERLERALKERAETLIGRLQIAVKSRDKLQESVGDEERAGAAESEIGPDRVRLQLAKRRVDGIARSLNKTADLLGQRGFETTQYRQFTIKTTGKITDRILDPKVLFGLVKDGVEDFWNWTKENAPTFFVKLAILLIVVFIFRLGFRLIWWILRVVGVANLTRLMADLVGRILTPVATILGLITGLWFLGVNPTTLLAGVGVASVIVGLALQDSLSNLAAGFFILVTRPFDVDDTIVGGGVLGTVRTMGLANTTIVTFDGRRVMIPNRKIWGENIENRSAEFIRRVEITVKIGYKEDPDNAIKILRDLAASEARVLESPEPLIFVSKLADSWVEIAVRPWVRNQDWWPLLTDLPRLVRNRFAEEGIEIPVPQRDVSISQYDQTARDGVDRTPE